MITFKTLPAEQIPKQKESLRLFMEAGLFKVAEILPKSVIASMQLKGATGHVNVPNRQFASIVEGEKWLNDEMKKV